MDPLQRLILVRHGETTGESSIRYHGATDVPLSFVGREQARASATRIPGETFEAVWSSSLSRAWQAARIIAPRHPIRLEHDFREIHFGRWEGLTRDEIATLDPELHEAWQAGRPGFEFPEGESRAAFRARIECGLIRLRESGVRSALIVAHKGVVRTLVELLVGEALPPEAPELGGVVHTFRNGAGHWETGRRASDPRLDEPAAGIAPGRVPT
jgi:broad specificity phosphatase PhoE